MTFVTFYERHYLDLIVTFLAELFRGMLFKWKGGK